MTSRIPEVCVNEHSDPRTPNLLRPLDPVGRFPVAVSRTTFHDDVEGLRFIVLHKAKGLCAIRLHFEGHVGYKISAPGGVRFNTFCDEVVESSSIFRVENSEWLKEIVTQASGVLHESALVHYAIFDTTQIIEVASAFKPDIEWIGGDFA